ncbi:hypothetical protein EL26_11610 [Tumebacillus flagellatus]|uniref:Uncharacterized protein n=1 Tax=Tumebacillus flagellatus TaxID=1157490 RepID=A0A074LTK7_9BACL|nr:hypothetical protein EL26_11610 [Tumebacillus flagellatus]
MLATAYKIGSKGMSKRLSLSRTSATQTFVYEIKPSAVSVNGFVVVPSDPLKHTSNDVVKVTVKRTSKHIRRRKGKMKADVVVSFPADLSEVII